MCHAVSTWIWKGGAFLEADEVGQRDHLRGTDEAILGVGLQRDRGHAHPGLQVFHVGRDRFDHSGRFHPRRLGQPRFDHVLAADEESVGKIDSGGMHLHEDGAWHDFRLRHLDVLEHAGVARLFKNDSLHLMLSFENCGES